MSKLSALKKYFPYMTIACATMLPLQNALPDWWIYLILIQVGTLVTSFLFFHRIFEGESSGVPCFFGMLFFMACPYRLYICYDLESMPQAVVWLLLPLYLWAAIGIARKKHMLRNIVAAALALAGIAYADVILMAVISGFTLFALICLKQPAFLAPLGAGWAIGSPEVIKLAKYLCSGVYDTPNIPLGSIMGKGYVLGDFFSFFVYRDGRPGIGLGIFAGLLTGLWLAFAGNQWEKKKECTFFAVCAMLLSFLAWRYFPWDFVQRIGTWALKFVALVDTPAIFFGMAQFCFCVPAAWAMGQAKKQKEKAVSLGVPLFVLMESLLHCFVGQ